MTTKTHSRIPLSIVVTPYKGETGYHNNHKSAAASMSPKSRLLGRANAQKHFFEPPSGVKSPISPTNNSSSRSNKERVFRCLSNTAAQSNNTSTITFNQASPEDRSALKQQQQQQLSFQPPILSSPKPQRLSSPVPKTQQHQQNKRVLVLTTEQFAYYGARIDRSKEYQTQLRPGRPCCPSAASSSDEHSEQGPPKVRFQPVVTAVQIPSHRDYTERTKNSIWSSVKELKANAVRNTAEYIHDKCKWRQCTEEHDFYFDRRTQELVHPVHVERYYAALEKKKKQKQEQDRLLAEQQEPEPMECSRNEENQQPTIREEESFKQQMEEEKEQARQQRQQEEEEEARRRQYRKRIRCCSPSPIRRQTNLWARHYTDNDSNMVEDDGMEHQPKRPRIQAPIPCRPMASYFSQAPPSTPSSVAAPNCPSYYHYHHSVHPQAMYPYHMAPQPYAYPPAGSFPYNPAASTAIDCCPLSPPTEVVGN